MAINMIHRLVVIASILGFFNLETKAIAGESASSQRLDTLFSPVVRAAIQPELFVKQEPMEPVSADNANPIDWLDLPLCHPGSPEPEEPTVIEESEPSSETLATHRNLPPSGVYPAGGGVSGGFGSLGSSGFTPGGGGAGGFPSFSPTSTSPSLSPTGGGPVIVRPTGGPVSPEPTSVVLFGSGLIGAFAVVRRKMK